MSIPADVAVEPAPTTADSGSRATRLVAWAGGAAVLAAACYLLARYVGLGPEQGPWAYWPINGVLCGLLFRRPYREWPAIALAAATAQVLTIFLVRGDLAGGATVVGAGVAGLQAALAAAALRRLGTTDGPLEHPRDLAWFVVIAVVLVPLITTPVSAAGFAPGLGLSFFNAWRPLFVGNSLSMLLFAPPLMFARARRHIGPWCANTLETTLAQVSIFLAALLAFATVAPWLRFVVVPYAMFPLLAWSAMRCGPRWTSAGVIGVATIAAWCTARGLGPFAPRGAALPDRVLELQVYLALLALTALLLSALSEERRRSFERVALDDAIREGFMDGSAAVLLLRDLAGRNVIVNERYAELARFPRDQLVGRTSRVLLPPDDAARVAARERRVIERGESLTFDESFTIHGVTRDFVVTRFPVRDAYGKVGYVGVIARDVTLERGLEERLRRTQRVEMIGTLAAGLAHDLNNLLTAVVMGAGELRTSEMLSADEHELVHGIDSAAAAAGRLTQRLLAFGRAEARRPVLLELDETLRELEPMLHVLVRGAVDLRLRRGAIGAQVLVDPLTIEQVVLNLVSNARDAIHGEGTITIATEVVAGSPDQVRLTVADTGVGMDEATRASLFEPFFTTKGTRGSGLGLYTTSLLVREARGAIDAASTPGRGSTFTVTLPVARASS